MTPKRRLVPIETIETLYALARSARTSMRLHESNPSKHLVEMARASIYELISAVEQFAESYNSFGGKK